MIQDQAAIFGEPGFLADEYQEISYLRPTNAELTRDQGIKVESLLGDPYGIRIGLAVSKDILGNPITAQPDMGAIEWTMQTK